MLELMIGACLVVLIVYALFGREGCWGGCWGCVGCGVVLAAVAALLIFMAV